MGSMACPISHLISAETSNSRWLPVCCYSCLSWLLSAYTESHFLFFKPLIHQHLPNKQVRLRLFLFRITLLNTFIHFFVSQTRPQTQTPAERPALPLDCVFPAFSFSTSRGRVSLYLRRILDGPHRLFFNSICYFSSYVWKICRFCSSYTFCTKIVSWETRLTETSLSEAFFGLKNASKWYCTLFKND